MKRVQNNLLQNISNLNKFALKYWDLVQKMCLIVK